MFTIISAISMLTLLQAHFNEASNFARKPTQENLRLKVGAPYAVAIIPMMEKVSPLNRPSTRHRIRTQRKG